MVAFLKVTCGELSIEFGFVAFCNLFQFPAGWLQAFGVGYSECIVAFHLLQVVLSVLQILLDEPVHVGYVLCHIEGVIPGWHKATAGLGEQRDPFRMVAELAKDLRVLTDHHLEVKLLDAVSDSSLAAIALFFFVNVVVNVTEIKWVSSCGRYSGCIGLL